jgi:hypothetical protein
LDDFDEFKKDLNIINKSIVTLVKPLTYEGTFVYIRDTMLLSPAESQSLDSLGKLYYDEGDYSKRFFTPRI